MRGKRLNMQRRKLGMRREKFRCAQRKQGQRFEYVNCKFAELKETARIRYCRVIAAQYVEQEYRLLTQTGRSADSNRDECKIIQSRFQIPRTTTATETHPPTRRSRGVAVVAPAVVRRAAPMWPAVRLWRRPEPAAGLARPRRPEARAPSRTTPPSHRRTSISPDGRTARIPGGTASGRVSSRRSAGRQRALRQRAPYHEETSCQN